MQHRIEVLPEIAVTPEQLGPLGVTLGPLPDAGGGRDASAHALPVVQPHWLDERELCPLVQACASARRAGDVEPHAELERCQQYDAHDGGCRRSPPHICALLEDEDAPVWRKALQWRRYRDGWLYVGDNE